MNLLVYFHFHIIDNLKYNYGFLHLYKFLYKFVTGVNVRNIFNFK